MNRKKLSTIKKDIKSYEYGTILKDVIRLVEEARGTTVRSVNTIITVTYWQIGQRIVVFEQAGSKKAEYGEVLLKRLAVDLTRRFGRGFGWRNIFQMRAFYLTYHNILQTPSTTLVSQADRGKLQTLSAISEKPISQTLSGKFTLQDLACAFPLPWSHYVRLLSVEKPEARAFYEAEGLKGGWSVRQLDRQINSLFYERMLLSRNKAALLQKETKPKPEDVVTPDEEIKDPLVLEFLNLKDEYSESDLEEALIQKIEQTLLEFGSDFAFVGRQRRLRIGDEWYRIDLLFYNRKLRCLIIIDLKLGKFTHADAGQMHLYLNYARENWKLPDENPPVGLILCSRKDETVVRYALEGLPNKIVAREYKMALPDEKKLATELEKTRKMLEARLPERKR